MKWLTSQLLKRNASFVEAEVYSLAELANTGKYDVIVNCTGLGAEKLLHTENDVYPVRGQVLRVKAPWMKAFWNFGLSYVIPNVDTVVLGGTAQVGDYNTGLSEEDTQMILDRVCELFPAIRDAPVERVWAGLRPCRKQGIRLESFLIRKTTARALCDVVRNEAESSELALSAVILAHCYGHGGCGVTLGMGCANDLVLNHIMPQLRELSLLM